MEIITSIRNSIASVLPRDIWQRTTNAAQAAFKAGQVALKNIGTFAAAWANQAAIILQNYRIQIQNNPRSAAIIVGGVMIVTAVVLLVRSTLKKNPPTKPADKPAPSRPPGSDKGKSSSSNSEKDHKGKAAHAGSSAAPTNPGKQSGSTNAPHKSTEKEKEGKEARAGSSAAPNKDKTSGSTQAPPIPARPNKKGSEHQADKKGKKAGKNEGDSVSSSAQKGLLHLTLQRSSPQKNLLHKKTLKGGFVLPATLTKGNTNAEAQVAIVSTAVLPRVQAETKEAASKLTTEEAASFKAELNISVGLLNTYHIVQGGKVTDCPELVEFRKKLKEKGQKWNDDTVMNPVLELILNKGYLPARKEIATGNLLSHFTDKCKEAGEKVCQEAVALYLGGRFLIQRNNPEGREWIQRASKYHVREAFAIELLLALRKGERVTAEQFSRLKAIHDENQFRDGFVPHVLGICYEFGFGIEKSEASARKFYQQAEKMGVSQPEGGLLYHDKKKEKLNEILARLSPDNTDETIIKDINELMEVLQVIKPTNNEFRILINIETALERFSKKDMNPSSEQRKKLNKFVEGINQTLTGIGKSFYNKGKKCEADGEDGSLYYIAAMRWLLTQQKVAEYRKAFNKVKDKLANAEPRYLAETYGVEFAKAFFPDYSHAEVVSSQTERWKTQYY